MGHSVLERPTADARSVDDLIRLARDGKIRMPRFQRGFGWGERDVDKLFDSIWRGFPIGSLLLWDRAAPAGTVAFGSYVVEAEETESALWVVDGQHRLTALVATLTRHADAAPPFQLFFDLAAERFVRRGNRRAVPVGWLPLDLLLDTSQLIDHLIEQRAGGLDDTGMSRAREVAATISNYRIPLNIVKTDDEGVLREIFYRMNSAGRRMTAAEVFRALHAALDPGAAGDLKTFVDDVNARGFGALREDTILRCVLAVRGGDVYRDFEQEFSDGSDPVETFAKTSRALEHVFAFLRDDAMIPHVRALPYNGVLPILTRFFALHPEPHSRTRNLLRRWVWRGSMAWGRDVGALRQAVQDVDEDELASVKRLLDAVGRRGELEVDLDAVQLNKAATKMNIALLSSLRPLDLRDGAAIDVASLLDDDGPGALLEVSQPTKPPLAGRLLHPALEVTDIVPLLQGASDDALASHVVPREAVEALLAGDVDKFARLRAEHLLVRLNEQRRRLAEPAADDTPPIATLTIPDP